MKVNFKINPAIHSEGERLRKIDEAYQASIKEKNKEFLVAELSEFLKPLLMRIIERAFKRYCVGHKASADMTELEWKRFSKILRGML